MAIFPIIWQGPAPGLIEGKLHRFMWRNGLSLNKKPSDDMNETERASRWGPFAVTLRHSGGAKTLIVVCSVPQPARWLRGAVDEFGSTEIYGMTLVPR
jgi:hypothetical protein